MDTKNLVGKTAADKNSKKLGKIIRIDNLPGKTIKKLKPYAIILIRRFLRKDIAIALETEKIIRIEGDYAWFNLTKAEFDEEVKRTEAIIIDRESYSGHLPVTRTRTGYSDPTGFSSRGKERKR